MSQQRHGRGEGRALSASPGLFFRRCLVSTTVTGGEGDAPRQDATLDRERDVGGKGGFDEHVREWEERQKCVCVWS